MTFKQALSVGAHVRKGERGTAVRYWKRTDRHLVRDARGKPVRDAEGRKVYRTVDLARPKVFGAWVFNAEQIDGLTAFVLPEPAWDRHPRCEALLAASGAEIRYDQANAAFYRPSTDRIHLPPRAQFPSADAFFRVVAHDLCHWTGAIGRLDRDLSHGFGTEAYAREELRAEIASLMLGERLGIGHDPGDHVAYVSCWIKNLRDDPTEILRASRDAEAIVEYLLAFESDAGEARALAA